MSAGYRKELRKSYAGLAGKKLENLKTELLALEAERDRREFEKRMEGR